MPHQKTAATIQACPASAGHGRRTGPGQKLVKVQDAVPVLRLQIRPCPMRRAGSEGRTVLAFHDKARVITVSGSIGFRPAAGTYWRFFSTKLRGESSMIGADVAVRRGAIPLTAKAKHAITSTAGSVWSLWSCSAHFIIGLSYHLAANAVPGSRTTTGGRVKGGPVSSCEYCCSHGWPACSWASAPAPGRGRARHRIQTGKEACLPRHESNAVTSGALSVSTAP